MAVGLRTLPAWESPAQGWRRLSMPCGDLDRAEAAAAAGDTGAAAWFFTLADVRIGEALVLAEAVNLLPGDGMARLREIAWRLADGGPEPTSGYAIEFRCTEDDDEISVWLTLAGVGPDTGALIARRRAD